MPKTPLNTISYLVLYCPVSVHDKGVARLKELFQTGTYLTRRALMKDMYT